jgi:hypothetical protein
MDDIYVYKDIDYKRKTNDLSITFYFPPDTQLKDAVARAEVELMNVSKDIEWTIDMYTIKDEEL